MKLKVLKRERKEVETEYDLPVYLYFQDEMCNDELVKITENLKITIKHDLFGFNINVLNYSFIEDVNFERCLTTESHFNQIYEEALKYLSNAVS